MDHAAPLAPELVAALDRLAVVRVDRDTPESILELIVTLITSTIERVQDASVSVDAGKQRTVSATSDRVRDLDACQYETGEGPCVAAIADARTHNVALSEETVGWPRFGAAALAAGSRSMLSVPLRNADQVLGSLNLYSAGGTVFADDHVAVAEGFAARASVVLANAMSYAAAEAVNRQLHTALETARVIGRAQGVLMVRQECDSDAAFEILRLASQRTNRKLREIAEEIVAPMENQPGLAS